MNRADTIGRQPINAILVILMVSIVFLAACRGTSEEEAEELENMADELEMLADRLERDIPELRNHY